LSPEEVARMLAAAPGVKYKAALSVAYGAGLRVWRFSPLLEAVSPHSMQDMHVEGLKLLCRAVSGHRASYRLSRLNLYMILAYAMVRPRP
jgi:hypothetical protein